MRSNFLATLILCLFSTILTFAQQQPDVAIKYVKYDKTKLGIGDSINISYYNTSSGIAVQTQSAVYLSKNKQIDAGDVMIFKTAKNNAHPIGFNMKVPDTLKEGYYYIIIKGDCDDQVNEADELNNLHIINVYLYSDPKLIWPDYKPWVSDIEEDFIIDRNSAFEVYLMHNNVGKVSSDSVLTHVYISKDKVIDAQDRLVLSKYYGTESSGLHGYIWGYNLFDLDGLEDGDYYFIEKIDPNNQLQESNENNNIHIRKAKLLSASNDVYVTDLVLDTLILKSRSSQVINYKIVNKGYEGYYKPCKINFYLSKDKIIDATDLLIGSSENYLKSNQSTQVYQQTIYPNSTWTSGSYHLIAFIDVDNSTKETNEANNIVFRSVTVADKTVDLYVVSSNNASILETYNGGAVPIQYYLNNSNITNKAATYVNFYLSKDSLLGATDLLIATDTGSFKSNMNTGSKSYQWSVPNTLAQGIFFVLGKIDSDNLVQEQNEVNNTFYKKIKVTSTSDWVILPETGNITASKCNAKVVYPATGISNNKRLSIATLKPDSSHKSIALQISQQTYYNYSQVFNVTYYNGLDTLAPVLNPENDWMTNALIFTPTNAAKAITIKIVNRHAQPNDMYVQGSFFYEALLKCTAPPKVTDFQPIRFELATQASNNGAVPFKYTAQLGGLLKTPVDVSLYLSKDSLWSSTDSLITIYTPQNTNDKVDTVGITGNLFVKHKVDLDKYYVIAKIDGQNMFAETNEDNNTISRRLKTKFLQQDIVVDTIILLSPWNPIGQTIKGRVRFRNKGTDAVGAFQCNIQHIDASSSFYFGYFTCPGIPANDTLSMPLEVCLTSYFKPQSSYLLNLVADVNSTYRETNENNNKKSFSLAAFLPDYTLKSNYLDPILVSCGTEINNKPTGWGNALYTQSYSMMLKPSNKTKRIRIELSEPVSEMSDETVSFTDLSTGSLIKKFTTITGTNYLYSIDSAGIRINYDAAYNLGNQIKVVAYEEPYNTSNNDLLLTKATTYANYVGQSAKTEFTVHKYGINHYGDLVFRYYLSDDDTLSDDDRVFDTLTVSGNYAKVLENQSADFTGYFVQFPKDVKPGAYYLITELVGTAASDKYSHNNVIKQRIQLSMPNSDIYLSYPKLDIGATYIGANYQLSYKNLDNRVGQYIYIDHLLSKDSNGNETLRRYTRTLGITKGTTTIQENWSFDTASIDCDTCFVIINADYQDEIFETDERNNKIIIPLIKKGSVHDNRLLLPEIAGQKLSICNAELLSNTIGGSYESNSNLTLTLKSSESNRLLQLNFLSFDTEKDHDVLWIYDGDKTEPSRLLGKYSGTIMPPVITASSEYITLRFVSNASVNHTGFRILLDCISPPTINDGIDLLASQLTLTQSNDIDKIKVSYSLYSNELSNSTFTNQFYLSKDSVWDQSDMLVSEKTLVAPTRSTQVTDTLDVSSIVHDDYYVILFVDACDQFIEYNEANNFTKIKTKLGSVVTTTADETQSNFSVYPNPTTGMLKLQGVVGQSIVYNLQGMAVLRSDENVLDLSRLESGLYMVKVQTLDGRVFSQSIVKK